MRSRYSYSRFCALVVFLMIASWTDGADATNTLTDQICKKILSEAELSSKEDVSPAARPPILCVDTFTCGGCCGNVHQVNAFLRCCERGGGFNCARRFGCR